MEAKQLLDLVLEVLKTLNNMNLEYMKRKTAFSTRRPLNFEVSKNNTTGYLGPHIWNSLSNQIKKETGYPKIKEFINDWFDMKCKCNLCSFLGYIQKLYKNQKPFLTKSGSNSSTHW